MRLYNTLTRAYSELLPLNAPKVSVYTCGPTVYDYPHIGNWFSFVRYDLLIRTLKCSGLQPDWVMNITDVGHLVSDADSGEDKLDKVARREQKSAWEIADYFSNYFINGLSRLNFSPVSELPRATDHIKEQIDFIKRLEEKGVTYKISDGVYFDVSKFPAYAEFARLDLDELQPGKRVEEIPEKRDPADFALWKFSPKDKTRDMEWDSPWGKGFPGWHIECSAMALKYLGETIDIHSGGIDHIPVHHTNEIAQSSIRNDKPLANIWMHTNHILIGDEKISKSLGNTVTLEDIEKREINLMALRLLILESHYRSHSKFTWESLEAASQRLLRFVNWTVLRYQLNTSDANKPLPDLLGAMTDDLNSPLALSRLEEFLSVNPAPSKDLILNTISVIDDLFGLGLTNIKDISNEHKILIVDRDKARRDGDWNKADALRDKLANDNIGLNDEPGGSLWHYLSLP